MQCPNYNGVLVAKTDSNYLIATVGCHMWTCPVCAVGLRAQWAYKITRGVQAIDSPTWAFWTLTAHRKQRGWDRSLANLQNGWKRLSARMRRYTGEPMAYCRVYEQHKDGSAHWHMICNVLPHDWKPPTGKTSPGSQWAKEQAVKCGLGYMVKVLSLASVDAPLVAAYVTKYMVKMETPLPKGTRRVQTSQNWPSDAQISDAQFDWKHYNHFLARDAIEVWDAGYDIIDVKTMTPVTTDNFLEQGEYRPNEQPK